MLIRHCRLSKYTWISEYASKCCENEFRFAEDFWLTLFKNIANSALFVMKFGFVLAMLYIFIGLKSVSCYPLL